MNEQDQKTLESLRNNIVSLDNQVLELISERLTLGKEIGLIKHRNNLPIKNQEVEDKIFNRVKILAPKIDLPSDIAVNIMKLLISESIKTQEKVNDTVSSSIDNSNNRKWFLIVGGLGKMGNWLVNLLISLGHNIDILDKGKSVNTKVFNIIPDLSKYDFIALCTPLINLNLILRNIIDKKPKAIIFDIGSLKSHILDDINYGIQQNLSITSIHPLFGPNIKLLYNKNLLLCSCGSDFANQSIKEIFAPSFMNIVEIPIEDHDKYMSISLGLSHALNLIFGHVLSKTGLKETELQNFSSTTFSKQIKTTKEVFSENIEMYHSIQHLNVNRDELYETISNSLNFVHNLVKNSEIKDFNEFAISTQMYFNS